jgi:hypothetical protein
MSRCSCCILAVSVLLALAVTATTTAALPHEELLQDKGDAHLLEEAVHLVGKGVATQGDDQSSSSGASGSGNGSGSGEHSKEGEGSKKEGDKQGKNCLTKELCHKKKIICGKECTLAAHSRCAAKCSKSCVPTC